jgi:hypothetical protein
MNPRRFGSGISLERVNPDYSPNPELVLVKCLHCVHSVLAWCMHYDGTSH